MNIEQFNDKYGHLKDSEQITIICDHPKCADAIRTIGKQAARRNILKNGGTQFICRTCCLTHNNPMNRPEGSVSRQTDELIEVGCPKCFNSRFMKMKCYYGSIEQPYWQVCGSCAQEGKIISEEQRQLASETLSGVPKSDEFKTHLSNYVKNNPEGIARGKANLIPGMGGIARKGQPLPEEWKQAISEGTKGKPKSEEHKQNISKGRKAMFAQRAQQMKAITKP